MNKTIRNLAIAALFIFPGLSGFPQEVQQAEMPAAQSGAKTTIKASLVAQGVVVVVKTPNKILWKLTAG